MPFRYLYYTLILYTWCSGQILITEVMYDLPGPDSPNEFVEVYNATPDTISLRGWHIRDKFTTDELVDTTTGYLIPPQSYFLIMEGDYNPQFGLYQNLIPENTPVLFVDDASIGNGLSVSDSLFLVDTSGLIVDSVGWTDMASDGYSIERIRLNQPNSPNNWAQSHDSLGTPGFQNSVFPNQIDGKIIPELTFAKSGLITPDDILAIQIGVTNTGIENISGNITIHWKASIIGSFQVQSFSPLDTVVTQINTGPFSSGYQSLVCEFFISNDENISDNHTSIDFGVHYEPGIIQLNEFLPIPAESQSEFVECVNISPDTINLENWVIRDGTAAHYYFPSLHLSPNRYFVISADPYLELPDSSILVKPVNGFPSLNNSGDIIRLYDPFGTLIDSLNYTADWGIRPGISMEKVFPTRLSHDSSNWKGCLSENGSTIGYRNSVMPWQYDIALIPHSFTVLPQYPESDTVFEISFQLTNVGLQSLSLMAIQIDVNEVLLIYTVSDTLNPKDTLSLDIPMPALSSGIYPVNIVVSQNRDQFANNNSLNDTILISYSKGSVTLNEFMPKPNNDQAEFVEIVAGKSVNLVWWSIHDSRSRSRLFPERLLSQNDYFIISPDSIITDYMPTNVPYLIDPGLPSLNNSGDIIKIVDHTGKTIDSLSYDGSWNTPAEQSLEKLHPTLESSQAFYWLPSNHTNGMTPGFLNSVTLTEINGAIVSPLFHFPFYPTATDSIEISLLVTNNGRQPVSGTITLELDEEEIGEISILETEWKDTVRVSAVIGPVPSGTHEIVGFFSVRGEEYPLDNIGYDTIRVSYPFGSVLINEFLAIPGSNQCEFVEIVNPNQIDFSGWGISDNKTSIRIFSFPDTENQQYLAILSDSSLIQEISNNCWTIPDRGFPGLSNTGDAIYIHDHTGFIVDSLLYNRYWKPEPGRSLEKFRPEYISSDSSRWALNISEMGISPGGKNSIYYESMAKTGELSLSPNPFSPDGDGLDDLLIIHFSAPFESPVVRAECFDILGRKVKTLVWNQPFSQEDIIYWNGKDDKGKPCRIGIYLIKFELVDQVTQQRWEELRTVVLAKPL